MHGIVRLLPGRKMAPGITAVCRSDVQRIISIDVALAALHRRVLVGQRETGCAVIELAVCPSRNRMARRTGCRSRGET